MNVSKIFGLLIAGAGLFVFIAGFIKWKVGIEIGASPETADSLQGVVREITGEWWMVVGLMLIGVGGILEQVAEQTAILKRRARAPEAPLARTQRYETDGDAIEALKRMQASRAYQVKGVDASGQSVARLIEAESSDLAKYTAKQEGMRKVLSCERA